MLLNVKNNNGVKFIDILVNNAGVLGANINDASEEQYDIVLNTNLKGVFFLSQLFGKYMVENKIKGNILNALEGCFSHNSLKIVLKIHIAFTYVPFY